ncbi:MAG TPA: ribosome assembly cofactor RimP [Bacteroidales bacterium]|nr:ribosome assembly cofactor RimP [Bacteroidales bacterium]HRZ49417.1 ribosome assembly cofactor RimP [Bacteroidales bacterium]
MVKEELLREIIERFTDGTDRFLVELSVTSSGQITVLMDGDSGFTIADCTRLSRHIEQHLDRDTEDYSLEVASYGVGNPLLLPRQYAKNAGRLLHVTTHEQEVIRGRIKGADETGVDLETVPPKGKKGGSKSESPQNIRLPYTSISKAVIEVEF